VPAARVPAREKSRRCEGRLRSGNGRCGLPTGERPAILRPVNDSFASPAGPRLRGAIETVYRVFQTTPPKAIEGCPCCLPGRRTDVLLATPLRDIGGQALWSYVSGAYLTVGDDQDFRYFLPRILEVSVVDPANANSPEIVLGKLKLASWRSWRPAEQRAIEDFVDAWFDHAVANDVAEAERAWLPVEAESVLCGAARAEMPLEPWLIRLHEPRAAAVLADLRRRYPGELSGFWDRDSPAFREFSAILSQGCA